MSIGSTGARHWEKPRSQPDRAAYSVREVAEQLGVCQASVYRALKRGDLEAVMLGRRRLILARSVEKLLTAQDQGGAYGV
jgi:excisionase family DNA binding protein